MKSSIKNKEKKSKRIYLDILLIFLIIGTAICLHLPSYKYTEVDKEYISEYEDENGDTYLHDMDSYYYVRKVQELSKDITNFTKSEDSLRGHEISSNQGIVPLFFPAFVSVIWKIVSFFFNAIPFMRFIRYVGPILSALACIPAYIFVKKRTNILGGLTAGFVAATSPPFFELNGFGCFDTDLLLFLLPLVFMCSFIEALQAKSLKKQLIWLGVLSLSYLLLFYTWAGHSIYYYLAIGLSLLFIFITLIKEKFNFKKSIKYNDFRASLIILLLLTAITLIINQKIDLSVFNYLLNLLKKDVFLFNEYPDPGKYISELISIPFFSGRIGLIFSTHDQGIINKMGGLFTVIASITTLIYLFKHGLKYITKSDKEQKDDYILFIVLFFWVLGGLISLQGGYRFTKIIAIPICLIVGIGIGTLYKYLSKKGIGLYAILMFTGFIVLIPGISALKIAQNQKPFADDALTNISDWIRKNTSKNAIIISWWDHGYYYEFRGERTTAADGKTYNGRYYYWLANIFITKDEHLSSAISKMIAYSGVEASALADEYAGSSKLGCEMLKEILVLNKEEAAKLLKDKYSLNDGQITELLTYTHNDEQREIIVIVTKDMLDKIEPISYYANYDFNNENSGVFYVDNESMMYRLFHNQNMEGYYKHLTSIEDPTSNHTGQIWKVVK